MALQILFDNNITGDVTQRHDQTTSCAYMLLADYLETRGYTQQAFADRLGCSRPTVSYWMRGLKHPRPHWVAKIRAATGGKVGAEDLQAAIELAA